MQEGISRARTAPRRTRSWIRWVALLLSLAGVLFLWRSREAAGRDAARESEPIPDYPLWDAPVASETGLFELDDGFLHIPKTITPAWQDQVRQELRRLLSPRPPGFTAIVESTAEPLLTGDVSLVFLRLQVSDGNGIQAALLRRRVRERPGPLIVVLHGHGPGLPGVLEPGGEQKAIAMELARAGFQVLAIETRTFGASRLPGIAHRPYAQRLRFQGREFHGQVVSDNLEILRWAKASIAHDGLGLVGCSMGGYAAMYLGALGGPFDACLVSGAGGSFRISSSYENCPCTVIPGLLNVLDADQILAAMSCRSISLELGRRDPYLGAGTLVDEGKALLAVAEQRGVAMEIHAFDGGHGHDRDYVIDYFRRSLSSDSGARSP